MSDPLDDLVREARGHLGKSEVSKVDWASVDAGLFARIAQERGTERSHFVAAGYGRRSAGVVAAVLAAAAAFAFVLHDGRDGVFDRGAGAGAGAQASVDGEGVGGRVVEVERGGRLLVDGRPSGLGAPIRLGDVLEAEGGGIVIERAGKLTMRIEAGSRAAVTHTDGALVLALARGAVEAQVVPVPSGEAFAVDVDGSRVAVHGTHLRVARSGGSGNRVTVDLNEGVVAVGSAPRVGSVVGSLVTAPAHAEFVAVDIGGSLAISHDTAAVRPPVSLGPSAHAAPAALAGPPASQESAERPAPAAAPVAARVSGAPAASPRSEVRPPAVTAMAAAPEPNADQALESAVRACMDQRAPAENVTVVVSTTLHLDLADDGAVRAARFDPPVAPDVNACAAAAIYRARFDHGGSETIRVDSTK